MSYILHKDEYGNIVGLDKNEPVLKHWKYKKKYQGPSGNWVYIYDDGSMSEAGSNSETKLVSTSKITWNPDDKSLNSSPYKQYHKEWQTTHYVTNPKQWRTTKSRIHVDGLDLNAHPNDREGSIDIRRSRVITYGRAHMMKMNLERKLSEFGDTIKDNSKTVKSLLSKFDKIRKQPKGASINSHQRAINYGRGGSGGVARGLTVYPRIAGPRSRVEELASKSTGYAKRNVERRKQNGGRRQSRRRY